MSNGTIRDPQNSQVFRAVGALTRSQRKTARRLAIFKTAAKLLNDGLRCLVQWLSMPQKHGLYGLKPSHRSWSLVIDSHYKIYAARNLLFEFAQIANCHAVRATPSIDRVPRPRVKRYHKQREAVAAAKDYCLTNWKTIIGITSGPLSEWSTQLAQWFGAAPDIKKLEPAADDALRKVREALVAIERFEKIHKSLGSPNRLPLASTFLHQWTRRHHRELSKLGRYSLPSLAVTPRQLIVQRSRSVYPQVYGPLRKALKAVDWTEYRLAAVSILVGESTSIPKNKLADGITAPEVVGIEAQYIHRAIDGFEKKLSAAQKLRKLLRAAI